MDQPALQRPDYCLRATGYVETHEIDADMALEREFGGRALGHFYFRPLPRSRDLRRENSSKSAYSE